MAGAWRSKESSAGEKKDRRHSPGHDGLLLILTFPSSDFIPNQKSEFGSGNSGTKHGQSKSNFFGRAWNRARGKTNVERIFKKVFDDLANKDTRLINSLRVATLMVYNAIKVGPHKDPPCMKIVAEKKEDFSGKGGIAFRKEVILKWVAKELRLVLANKAAVALLGAPPLTVTARNAGRQEPMMRDVVDKVPTPLIAPVFYVGLMLLQDVRVGKQRE